MTIALHAPPFLRPLVLFHHYVKAHTSQTRTPAPLRVYEVKGLKNMTHMTKVGHHEITDAENITCGVIIYIYIYI